MLELFHVAEASDSESDPEIESDGICVMAVPAKQQGSDTAPRRRKTMRFRGFIGK